MTRPHWGCATWLSLSSTQSPDLVPTWQHLPKRYVVEHEVMPERRGGVQAYECGYRIAQPVMQLLEFLKQPFVRQDEIGQGKSQEPTGMPA